MTNRSLRRDGSKPTATDSGTVAGEANGVAYLYPGLKLIALDREAKAILDDLNGQTRSVVGLISLPTEILDPIGARAPDGAGAIDLCLAAGGREYSCRCLVMKSPTGTAEGPTLALHLKKELPVAEIVRQVGKDYRLTGREQEVLIGVSMGFTTKELAARMEISSHTIKAFLHRIMLKMGATTRAGMLAKVLGARGSD